MLVAAVGAALVAGVWAFSARTNDDVAQDMAACASSRPDRGDSRLQAHARGVPRFSHVVVVVMENKDCGDVIGSPEAPYVNALARRYALASTYYAIAHPSLPNYLALTGGSTFGINADCKTCHLGATNLVDQLEAAGLTWKAYMGAMPSPCFQGTTAGLYARKHNPFMYYDDVAQSRRRCSHVVPLDGLSTDLRNRRLPAFSWITPDLCDDTHNKACSIRTGDRFLARLMPPLIRAVGTHGVVFLTWDEGEPHSTEGCCTLARGGHVATIVAGPLALPGGRSKVSYDHYSLLRTIEDGFGLAHLRHAGCNCTRSLTDLLKNA